MALVWGSSRRVFCASHAPLPDECGPGDCPVTPMPMRFLVDFRNLVSISAQYALFVVVSNCESKA